MTRVVRSVRWFSERLLCVCWLLLAPSRSRAEDATKRYLVGPIAASESDIKLAKSIEEFLVLELGKRQGISVVTSSEMAQTLHFSSTKAELGCDELEACVAQVRHQLSVAQMTSGQLGRLGRDLVLTLRVVDTSTSSVTARATLQAQDVEGLRAQLKHGVDVLIGVGEEAPRFHLSTGDQLKVAVMPLAARGVPEATAGAMTQILSAELNQLDGVDVLGRDDINAMLDKVSIESDLGCTENAECIAEIGAALGLSKLVSGAVGKVGDSYVISAQLIDTREASVQNRVIEAYEGDVIELKHAVKLVAYQVVGADYKRQPGVVDFSFNVGEAEVLFGERRAKLADGELKLNGLEPGRYAVRVLANQKHFFPLQTDVYVAPGLTNVRTFDLAKRPAPWFRSWWFWTIAGAVVAGAAATTVVLLADSAPLYGSGTVTIAGQ